MITPIYNYPNISNQLHVLSISPELVLFLWVSDAVSSSAQKYFFHVAEGTPLGGACVKMDDSWTLKQLLDGKWRREASSTWAQGHSEAKLKQRGMAVKPWDMSARPIATGNRVLI